MIARFENAVRPCDLGDESRKTLEITDISAESAEFLPRKSVTCPAQVTLFVSSVLNGIDPI